MDGEAPEAPNPGWDVRIARQRKRLEEADYRAALARGEIVKTDTTAHVVRGDALIAQIQEECGHREVMLAFSCGKDSIAAYLAIREKFSRVVPYFMEGIPGLEFVEDSLRYYERELFDGEPIIRLPHPSLYMQLASLVFQTPDRVPLLIAADLGGYDHDLMRELIVEEARLPENTMIATGLRAFDNTMRRMACATYGPINRKAFTFWPIWDWNKARVIDTIKAAQLHLPVDYDLFGRTWDGICAEDLIPIRKHFPRDYARILEWFPLADVELFRLQRFGGDPLDGEDRHPCAEDRGEEGASGETAPRRFSSLAALPSRRRSAGGIEGHGQRAGEREAGIEGDPEPV